MDEEFRISHWEEKEVAEAFKGWMWFIFQAIKHNYWDKIKEEDVFNKPEFKQTVISMEPYFFGLYGKTLKEYIEDLKDYVDKKDATNSYCVIAEVLLSM